MTKTIEDIYITSKQEMIDAVNALGILPLFSNTIKGFSIEERCAKEVYFSSSAGIWEWKGPVSYDTKYLYDLIASHYSVLSKQLKSEGGYVKPRKNDPIQWEARKGFDTQLTKLQKLGYITTTNFEYEMDKRGEFYGWGIARYATFENAFGKKFSNHVYDRSVEESYLRLFKQLKKILPHVEDNEIEYYLHH